ncbi:MAG: PEP/pyruvate-binding domain-containing protein [Candidatus Firestonebacteria bacterium]
MSLTGGRGYNLGEINKLGLLIPKGFCITTSAYYLYLSKNHINVNLKNPEKR